MGGGGAGGTAAGILGAGVDVDILSGSTGGGLFEQVTCNKTATTRDAPRPPRRQHRIFGIARLLSKVQTDCLRNIWRAIFNETSLAFRYYPRTLFDEVHCHRAQWYKSVFAHCLGLT